MRVWFFALLVFFADAGTAAFAETTANRCDLSGVARIDTLQARLQDRAVETVNLAASGIEESRLQQVIEPSATFSSGGGDVGIPFGTGISGFNALVKHMNADTYRLLNWDYIPAAVPDPCGTHEVSVEFIRSADKVLFPVKFTFNAGRIISAIGWSRTFSTGPVKPVRN